MGIINKILDMTNPVTSETFISLVGNNFVKRKLNSTKPTFDIPSMPTSLDSNNIMMSSNQHNTLMTSTRSDITSLYNSSNYLWDILNSTREYAMSSYKFIKEKVKEIKSEIKKSNYINTTIDSGFNDATFIDFWNSKYIDVEKSNCFIDDEIGTVSLPITERIDYNKRIDSANIDSSRGITSPLFYKIRSPMLAFDESDETYWAEYVMTDDIINVPKKSNSSDIIDNIMNHDSDLLYNTGTLCALSTIFGTSLSYINEISLLPYCDMPVKILGIYGITSEMPWQKVKSPVNYSNVAITHLALENMCSGSLYYKVGEYGDVKKVCDITVSNNDPDIIVDLNMYNYITINHDDDVYFAFKNTSSSNTQYSNITYVSILGYKIEFYDNVYMGDYNDDYILTKSNVSYDDYIYDNTKIKFNAPIKASGLLFLIAQEHYKKDIFLVNKNKFGYNNLIDNIILNHGISSEYRENTNMYNTYYTSDNSFSFMEKYLRDPSAGETRLELANSNNLTDYLFYSPMYTHKTYSYIYGMFDIIIKGNTYEKYGKVITKELEMHDNITTGLLVEDFIPLDKNGAPLSTIEWDILFNGKKIPIAPYNKEYIWEYASTKDDLRFSSEEILDTKTVGDLTAYKYKPSYYDKIVFLNKNESGVGIYTEKVEDVFYGTDLNNSITLNYTPYIDSSYINDSFTPNGNPVSTFVPIDIIIEGPSIEYTYNNTTITTSLITQYIQNVTLDNKLVLYNATNYTTEDVNVLIPFDETLYPRIEYMNAGNKITFSREFNSNYKIKVKYYRVPNSFKISCTMKNSYNSNITPMIDDLNIMTSDSRVITYSGGTLGATWGGIKSPGTIFRSTNVLSSKKISDDTDSKVKTYLWKWKRLINCGNNTDSFYVYINSTNTTVYQDLTNSAFVELDSLGEPVADKVGKTYNVYHKDSNEVLWINGSNDSNPDDDIDNDIFNIGILVKPGESVTLGMRFLLTDGDDTDLANGLCYDSYVPFPEDSFSVDIVSAHPYDYKLAPSWCGDLEEAKRRLPLYDNGIIYNDKYKYDKEYYVLDTHEPSPYIQLCPFN